MRQSGTSRATLGELVDDVGATFFEGIVGTVDPQRAVADVVIHDADDESTSPDAVVLGVGLHDSATIAATIEKLAPAHPAALVVREPVSALEPVAATAAAHGIPILALTRAAAWGQVAAVLRTVVVESRTPHEPGAATLGGLVLGDLFGAANAIAALVDAPIIIEDRRGRVLAFSGRQDEADRSRVESILGRQVPEATLRAQMSKGVFRELYASDGPIWVEPGTHEAQTMGRTVIAVRAGGEVLGSIWVAVAEPLSPERTQALIEGAQLLALHLLQHRAGADATRRARVGLVGDLLTGGDAALDAAARLGLAHGPVLVAALATPASGPAEGDGQGVDAATRTAERQRLADAFAMHLDVVIPGGATALQGEVTYAVVPAVSADPVASVMRVAEEFLGRISSPLAPVIAIGSPVEGVAELPRSRAEAQRVLRVLLAAGSSPPVASLREVQTEAVLAEIRDLMRERGEPVLGSLTALRAHDAERGGHLVATLQAWLEAFGDVGLASAAVFVHPNTFRYRLRQAAKIAGIDLSDPDDRFAAMLQLRLDEPGPTPGTR